MLRATSRETPFATQIASSSPQGPTHTENVPSSSSSIVASKVVLRIGFLDRVERDIISLLRGA